MMRSLYDLTVEEFEIRLQAQGGLCLICQSPMDVPQIDHDHSKGHVRGILCRSCNVGLGFFRDDAKALRRAAIYLEKYKNRLG